VPAVGLRGYLVRLPWEQKLRLPQPQGRLLRASTRPGHLQVEAVKLRVAVDDSLRRTIGVARPDVENDLTIVIHGRVGPRWTRWNAVAPCWGTAYLN
jgi:hypothetical protein